MSAPGPYVVVGGNAFALVDGDLCAAPLLLVGGVDWGALVPVEFDRLDDIDAGPARFALGALVPLDVTR